jgi:dUTP pyrophosphatase
MSTIINSDDIRKLLKENPPIVEGLLDIEEQLQSNGIDLTVKTIASFTSPGAIGFNNKDRILSDSSLLPFNNSGFIDLATGCYLITYNEVVHIPINFIALGLPRSSLLRCGASVHTAVWDAGYSGRSQSLLVVYNSNGFQLYKNAKVLQLIFLKLSHPVIHGYKGIFQKENL